MKDFQYITSQHPAFVENLYQDFVKDPESVDPEFRKFFEGFDFAIASGKPTTNGNGTTIKEVSPVATEKVVEPAAIDPGAIGWKGELGVYMKSDGGPKPSRVHFRGPSFVNLSALPMMSEGEMVADIVAIIGSLDIVLGEIDR